MNVESVKQKLGIAEVEQVQDNLTELEKSLPVEPNRKQRREGIRHMRRVFRKLDGMKRMYQPLHPKKLTPYGAKKLRRRRAAEAAAKKARKRNYT